MNLTPTIPAGSAGSDRLTLEIAPPPPDGARFDAALEQQLQARGGGATGAAAGPAGHTTLGEQLATRASDLSSELKKDQQHISRMLESASSSGDSMQLMKAMMALSDYQMRVQTIARTVSKASQAFDQLTKLQ
ncbi:type III secretion protein [Oxalobacteraceae bacterium]|nr:type III secretion protein [Oxalobacteraceae bacterium]